MALDPQISSALTNVAVIVIGLVGAAVTALGAYGLILLQKKLGLDKNAESAARFESIVANGMSTAAQIIGKKVAEGVPVGDLHAAVVSEAMTYVAPKASAEMTQLGMAPESLRGRVAARVAAVLPTLPKNAPPEAVTDALNAAQLQRTTP